MPQEPASDEMAKQLREAWFRYLDTIVPIRPSLYRYCRRITRDIWDAEDLLQETLLKGFGAIGRGDLAQEWSRVKDSRTYLFRVATNLWIDQVRRRELRSADLDIPRASSEPQQSIETREAVSVLMSRATPQERAALILKDVFDFTLEEIAVILTTTVGAVKSALHRGRAGMEEKQDVRGAGYRAPSKDLLDRFVAAFNARDVNVVISLLLDNTTYEVAGVGGERGKKVIWTNVPQPETVRAEPVRYNGEWMVVFWFGEGSDQALGCVDRFEEEDGYIARIITYYYCPDTLKELAAEFGVRAAPNFRNGTEAQGGYHQNPEVLSSMIASAVLPWAST
jgi:RNA polymerase sigma-70 factor (ECF subfamily)